MNPVQFQLNVNCDSDAVVDLLVRAIETGTGNCLTAILQAAQQRAVQEAATSATVPVNVPKPTLVNDESSVEAKLIDVNAVATMLSVSSRMIRRLRDSGGMPKPVIIGRLVRRRSEAIEEWIQAGCPTVERRGTKR